MKLINLITILGIFNAALYGQSGEPSAQIFKKHGGRVRALAFNDDGQILASGGDDKVIFLWNVNSGDYAGIIENYFGITALQFTPDNLILAGCGTDIKLMSKDGKLVRTFKGYTTDIWSLDYNPRNHSVIAGSYAKSIKVWNFENGSLLLTLTGHEKSCLPVKIDPAGNLAASGSLDKSVRLWDMATGKELKKLDIHSENIFSVDFHTSGKYVISASADKTLRLWSIETGKVIRTFIGHEGSIFDVRFSPDGNHILSCGEDKSIILWETATGRMLYNFTGHEATVNRVRFSPDGLKFASASDDQTVRIWNLEKSYFVEPDFGKEIEESITDMPLFAPRRQDETRQAYAVREQEAKKYLRNLYEQYYVKYQHRIGQIKIEENTVK